MASTYVSGYGTSGGLRTCRQQGRRIERYERRGLGVVAGCTSMLLDAIAALWSHNVGAACPGCCDWGLVCWWCQWNCLGIEESHPHGDTEMRNDIGGNECGISECGTSGCGSSQVSTMAAGSGTVGGGQSCVWIWDECVRFFALLKLQLGARSHAFSFMFASTRGLQSYSTAYASLPNLSSSSLLCGSENATFLVVFLNHLRSQMLSNA